MASKYWIGSDGDSASDDTNWSTTSGGYNNTSHPVAGDTAIFDGNGDTNCMWDIDDNVVVQTDTSYTHTITLNQNIATNGLSSFDLGGGTLALSGYTLGLVAGNTSYIRADGTLLPNGAIQSTSIGSQHIITLYGTIDWDYGGSGSTVDITDIELVLVTDTITGGGGVTINIGNSILKSSDEGATTEVNRSFTLSSNDSLVITDDIALFAGGENYSANLELYLHGKNVTYSGTPIIYAYGGPHVGFGNSQIYNLDTNALHLYGIEVSGGQLYLGGSPYGVIQIDNKIQTDTLTELFFAYNYIIVGTDTSAGTITNNGSIIPLSNDNNQTKIEGASSSYPAVITGKSIDWDYSGAQTVYIGNVDIQSAQTTGGNGVTINLTGDISITDLTISINDTLKANSYNITQSRDLIVDGIIDAGTSTWTFNGTSQSLSTTNTLSLNNVIIDSNVEMENTKIDGTIDITSGFLEIKNYNGVAKDYYIYGNMNWNSPSTYVLPSTTDLDNGINIYVEKPDTGSTTLTFNVDNIGFTSLTNDANVVVATHVNVYAKTVTNNGSISGNGDIITNGSTPYESSPIDGIALMDVFIDDTEMIDI